MTVKTLYITDTPEGSETWNRDKVWIDQSPLQNVYIPRLITGDPSPDTVMALTDEVTANALRSANIAYITDEGTLANVPVNHTGNNVAFMTRPLNEDDTVVAVDIFTGHNWSEFIVSANYVLVPDISIYHPPVTDTLTIKQVNSLPSVIEKSWVYLEKTLPGEFDIKLSDKDGAQIFSNIGSTDLDYAISDIISQGVSVTSVPTIEALNTLQLYKNKLVFVVDASDDPTVNAGSAMYVFNATNSDYTIVAKSENLDIETEYELIEGITIVTPAEIDTCVMDSHEHSNYIISNLGSTNGNLTYNGKTLGDGVNMGNNTW